MTDLTLQEAHALAKSAENDCQRAINRAQKAEHDLKCLKESTVDVKAYEQKCTRLEAAEAVVETVRHSRDRTAKQDRLLAAYDKAMEADDA